MRKIEEPLPPIKLSKSMTDLRADSSSGSLGKFPSVNSMDEFTREAKLSKLEKKFAAPSSLGRIVKKPNT